jgi:hypothetical protein
VLDRLSSEIAVVQHVTETEAAEEIEGHFAKAAAWGQRRMTKRGPSNIDAIAGPDAP